MTATSAHSTPVPASPPVPVQAPAPRSDRASLPAWCAAHRWRVLVAGLLVLAGAVVLLGGGITTTKPVDELVGDSAQAAKITAAADFGDRPTENVVVTPIRGAWGAHQADQAAAALRAAYSGVDGVFGVGKPVLSPDGRTVLLPVALDVSSPGFGSSSARNEQTRALEAKDVVGPMLAVTSRFAAGHRDLRVGQVGPGSIDNEVGTTLNGDFRRAELSSLPVTLAVLLVAFGSAVAAGVPLLLAIGAVVVALGLTAYASRHVIAVDENTQSLVLLIGLAVGVDYCLFIIRRAREERAGGMSVRESIVRAGSTAGRAVVISGATVVVAMSGMLVAGGMFTSLAVGSMLVVGVAVVASATILPAVLSVLGDRVDRLRLPLTRRRAARRGSSEGAWGRLAGAVTRRPLAWAMATTVLLLAMAAPALAMRTSLYGVEALPESFQTVQAYKRLTAAFPQDGTTVDVVVAAPAGAAGQVRQALTAAFPKALATGEVVGTAPQIAASTDGTVHVMHLAVPGAESAPRTADAVAAVRGDVLPAVRSSLAGQDGVSVHVGGAGEVSDLTRWMDQRLPWVVAFVLALTFIVMLVSFGSPALAAATVGLNLLSVAAAYGVMTAVFQHTWAQGLLGFTSVASIAAWLPLLMFVILFGLSMDYHVFVVSRVREAYSSGVGPREAVRLGVARSAGVVTSAAAVMVAVFAIFGTLSTLEMKQLGVGLATAVLLDATLVRGVLLPAVLALLGRRAHTGPAWVPVLHH